VLFALRARVSVLFALRARAMDLRRDLSVSIVRALFFSFGQLTITFLSKEARTTNVLEHLST